MSNPAVPIILFLFNAVSCFALQVEFRTDSQINVRGEVVSIENGFLYVATNDYQSIGIPLTSISNLKPTKHTDLSSTAREMLQFREVLHLWDIATQMKLVDYAETLAEKDQWNACYQSASCIERCSDPSIARAATELKALALFQMGLYAQCEEVIGYIRQSYSPLQASVRVSWMMAQLAMLKGDRDRAVHWAVIPKLRIPCDDSPVADQLYKDCQKWLHAK